MRAHRDSSQKLTAESQIAACRKADREKFKVDHSAVAKVVFSSPAFASVGMTEEEAVEAEKDVDVFTSNFTSVAATGICNNIRCFFVILLNKSQECGAFCRWERSTAESL